MKKSYLLITISLIIFSCVDNDDMENYRKESAYLFFKSSRDNSNWVAEETSVTYYKYRDYCIIGGSNNENQEFSIYIEAENMIIGEKIKDFSASHSEAYIDVIIWDYSTLENKQNNSYLYLEEFDTINNIIKGKFKLELKESGREGDIIKLTNGEFKANISISDKRDMKALQTQQDVIEFGAKNLINFNGLISIGDNDTNNPNSSITDLSPLNSLKTVERITIKNTTLTNLIGLHNIESISELYLTDNTKLTDLNALNNCNVTNTLSIDNNDSLTDLNGLSETMFVGINEVLIAENDLLENLVGLENITSIDYDKFPYASPGVLYVKNNNSLISIDGLNNLLNIENFLIIIGNPLLTDFCGIQPLMNNSFNAKYNISENAFNPTQQDLIDGNCSQ